MKVARRQKKKASYNMLIRLRFFWRHEGRTAPIFLNRQSTPGLKVILFRRYITSIKMTFDPGVGVPPTGAAASLAPRFLTVLGFYRLFPVRSLPSRMNRERCGNSARPVSRCADSHWRVHAWWAERVQAASTATIIRVRRESGLPPPTSGSCSPPPPPPPPPAG